LNNLLGFCDKWQMGGIKKVWDNAGDTVEDTPGELNGRVRKQ
jgi:hypothetical protein